jgi:hypothetical protein
MKTWRRRLQITLWLGILAISLPAQRPAASPPLGWSSLELLLEIGADEAEILRLVAERGLAWPRDGRSAWALRERGLTPELTAKILAAGRKHRGDDEIERGVYDPALGIEFSPKASLAHTAEDGGGSFRMSGLPEGHRVEVRYRRLDLPLQQLKARGIRDLNTLFEKRVLEISKKEGRNWKRGPTQIVAAKDRLGLEVRFEGSSPPGFRTVYRLTWYPHHHELLSFSTTIVEAAGSEARARDFPSPFELPTVALLRSLRHPSPESSTASDSGLLILDEKGVPRRWRREGGLSEPLGPGGFEHIARGLGDYLALLSRGTRLDGLPRDPRLRVAHRLSNCDGRIRALAAGPLGDTVDVTVEAPGGGSRWLRLQWNRPSGGEDSEPFRLVRSAEPPGALGGILSGHRNSPWYHARDRDALKLVREDPARAPSLFARGEIIDACLAPRPEPDAREASILSLRRERDTSDRGDRVVLAQLGLSGERPRELWSTRIPSEAGGSLRLAVTPKGRRVFLLVPGLGLLALESGTALPLRILEAQELRDFTLSG